MAATQDETNVSDRDGLAKRVARKLHGLENTATAWDLKFVDAGDGWAICSMVVRDDMLNGHGTAHGGMIFALADTAFAWACNSHNQVTVAQQASISYLSAAMSGETLTAEARKEGGAGRSGHYTVRVTGTDDRLVAVFSGLSRSVTGIIIDPEEEKSS